MIKGSQLKKAREFLQFEVEEVAERIGVSAEEILSWEEERAKPRLIQLEDLADFYGREIDYFLKETPDVPTQVQFRSASGRSFRTLSKDSRRIIAEVQENCRIAYEIENMLGKALTVSITQVPKNKPPSELAQEQRNIFEVNGKPVKKLKEHLSDMGSRVFELEVPGNQFSGFSCWFRAYGPCILINATDLPGRKNFTLAHEYAHLLYGHAPLLCEISEEVLGEHSYEEEQLAKRFTIEFLLPSQPIKNNFLGRGLSTPPTSQEVGKMAGFWQVSVQAMAYRLEDLSLIERGYANKLLASIPPKPEPKFRRGLAKEMKIARKIEKRERQLGKTYVSNTFEAYHKGLISLGKLAHSLKLPIREALESSERPMSLK